MYISRFQKILELDSSITSKKKNIRKHSFITKLPLKKDYCMSLEFSS